jgi:ribosomal protein S18 acetylase RimI-like enzyme
MNAHGLPVRRAAPADANALLPLMRAFNVAERIAWDPVRARPALERLVESDDVGVILVAVHADALAGYAVVTWGFDLEYAGRDAFVTELFVEPGYRRQRVGRTLLDAAIAAAWRGGAAALHLLVDPANDRAIALYAGAGFERSPRAVMTLASSPRS